MDKYVDQLRRKMLLMRSFLGLSWWKSTRFWEGKLSKIKDRVTVKDQLTKRIDNLAGLEVIFLNCFTKKLEKYTDGNLRSPKNYSSA